MRVSELWKKKYKYEIGQAMGVVWNWKYRCKLMISKIYISAYVCFSLSPPSSKCTLECLLCNKQWHSISISLLM